MSTPTAREAGVRRRESYSCLLNFLWTFSPPPWPPHPDFPASVLAVISSRITGIALSPVSFLSLPRLSGAKDDGRCQGHGTMQFTRTAPMHTQPCTHTYAHTQGNHTRDGSPLYPSASLSLSPYFSLHLLMPVCLKMPHSSSSSISLAVCPITVSLSISVSRPMIIPSCILCFLFSLSIGLSLSPPFSFQGHVPPNFPR